MAIACLTLACLTLACRQRVELPPLEPIPHPDLQQAEAVVREQVRKQREVMEKAMGREEPRTVGNLLGSLGELYHVYGLGDAAAATYRNAETLAPNNIVWPYLRGVLAQESGNLERAAEIFDQVVKTRPQLVVAQLRRAQVLLELGRGEDAEVGFHLADDHNWTRAAALFGLARLATDRGATEEAAAAYEQVLELQPEASSVYRPLAQAYRQLGRDAEAEELSGRETVGQVTFNDPMRDQLDKRAISSGALLQRGNRALALGQHEEAITAYRQAIEANTQLVEGYRNLAQALVQTGDLSEAALVLDDGLEQAADNPWLHLDLGNVLLSRSRGKEAVASFRRAVELAPDLKAARFNLANALAAQEQWKQAKPELEQAVALDPADQRAAYLLAMALHKTGDSAEAVRRFESLITADPQNLLHREGLATVHLELQRPARAVAAYRRALAEVELEPEQRLQTLSRIAELSWRQGRRQEAIAAYGQAVEENPQSSAAATNLGNVLQLTGQRLEAAEIFARATELDPGNVEAVVSETSLWILLRRWSQARDRLETALERLPNEARLVHNLARLLATCPDASVRDGERALMLSRRAFGMDNKVDHAETVAMAMAELGQFDKAAQWQRALAARAAQGRDQALTQRLVNRLAMYERREAVRISGEG